MILNVLFMLSFFRILMVSRLFNYYVIKQLQRKNPSSMPLCNLSYAIQYITPHNNIRPKFNGRLSPTVVD